MWLVYWLIDRYAQLVNILDTIYGRITDVAAWRASIKTFVVDRFSKLWDVCENWYWRLYYLAGDWYGKIHDVTQSWYDKIKDWRDNWYDHAKELAKDRYDHLVDFAKNWYSKAKELANDRYERIRTVVLTWYEKLRQALVDWWDRKVALYTDFWPSIKYWYDNRSRLLHILTTAWEGLFAFTTGGIVGKAVAFFTHPEDELVGMIKAWALGHLEAFATWLLFEGAEGD